MKHFIALTLALTSFSAFTATEFYTKYGFEECTIAKNKVTKTVKVTSGAGFTKTSNIDLFGLDEIVTKAVAVASGRTSSIGIVFKVTVDGQITSLSLGDSKESDFLISFISKACN